MKKLCFLACLALPTAFFADKALSEENIYYGVGNHAEFQLAPEQKADGEYECPVLNGTQEEMNNQVIRLNYGQKLDQSAGFFCVYNKDFALIKTVSTEE